MQRFSLPAYLLPRPRDVLFLLIFLAALAAGWRTLNSDGDLPRHLLMGRTILETRSIPHVEMFSYVYAGRPYVAHEWLADVVYYLAYLALGLGGVVLVTAVLIASTFLILYAGLVSQYHEPLLTLLLVGWGAVCSYGHWIARPHLFSMLFLSIWLVGVDRLSRGQLRRWWLLPALMVVWANTHAEFVAGFLVLLAYLAGWLWSWLRERSEADPAVLRSLALTTGFSAIASLLNPFGFAAWATILRYLANTQLMSTIAETKPPDFSTGLFAAELGLIILSVLVLGLHRGRLPAAHIFLLCGFTVLAMRSGRNIHLYSIVAPFVLAGPAVQVADSPLLRKLISGFSRLEAQLKGVAWPVAIVLAGAALLASGRIGADYRFDPKIFPVQSVRWLEQHPQPGRMFNDFVWGGYMVWKLWPAQQDFIDSQMDLSGEATRQYGMVQDLAPGWRTVLDQYQVAWAILPVDSPLSRQLLSDGWSVLHQDATAIVLRRR